MRRSIRITVILIIVSTFLITTGLASATHPTHNAANLHQDDLPPATPVKIGEIQGAVNSDIGDPQTFSSPLSGERVQISGVVTNPIAISIDSRVVNGFFLQETAENSDGDPTSSDGIFVTIGAGTSLDDYTPVVGDIITVEGEVQEVYDNTRLRRTSFVSLDGQVDDINIAIPPVEINPNSTLLENSMVYESLEGMRVSVPAGSIVVSPTHLFSSTNDTEVYVVRNDHIIAQREDPFARRVFRDTHELDDGVIEGNPFRISVEANILKALEGDYNLNLPIYNTYDVFTTSLVGNLIYAFGRYTLQIEALPDVEVHTSPTDNAPVIAPDRSIQYSIATYNVENLYDYYNDAFDRRDTPGDTRLNYVPLSIEDYEIKVNKIAMSIVFDLHSPDVIAFEELEDQDVCVDGGQLFGTCGNEVDNADGQPDVLQDVAVAIAGLTNNEVIYAAILDRDSTDDRGIIQGFFYRTDRVEMPEATPDDPVLGSRPDDPVGERYEYNQEVSNPKSLNDHFGPGTPVYERAPVVGLFRIHRETIGSDDYVDVYVSANHFKSVPDSYNEQRQRQALYNLSFVEALQVENPDVYFIVTGDLNAFQESSDLAVLEPVLDSLWDKIAPQSRYTYIFEGQTQTLDYIYATPNMIENLAGVQVAHINADFSYSYENDPSTSIRAADHDPIVATFSFPE